MEPLRGSTANEKTGGPLRLTMSQLVPVMIKNLLLVTFGMTLGFPTIIIPYVAKCESSEEICLDGEEISWVGSLIGLCIPFGCLPSGVIAQAIGRKITMQTSSVLLIIGWIIVSFSNGLWMIYGALIIFGFTAGLFESPVLTYVSEICEPRLRGSFLSLGSVCVTLGTLFEFLLGSILHWRSVALYSMVAPVACFVLLFFIPESPHWLISKNKHQRARKSLAWVRGWTTVDKIELEFQEIMDNCNAAAHSTQRNTLKIRDYLKPNFTRPFFLVCYLLLFFFFSGSQSILIYAVNIFETMRVPLDEYDATVILGLGQFLGALTCVVIIRYTGRRVLAFICITVTALSMIIVATYAYLNDFRDLNMNSKIDQSIDPPEHNWIPLVFILLPIFAITCGVRILAWALLSECFPYNTRAVGIGTLGALAYMFGFVTNKTFLDIVTAITLPGILWFYGGASAISLVVVYLWVPETEGKSLQEISDHFAGKTRLDNKVKRNR